MRMWLVNPTLLCRKHLLGEHVELHMLVGTLLKGISIQGYITKGLVETSKIYTRHAELQQEIINRGYMHKSPLPVVNVPIMGKVSISENLKELSKRCPECLKRINNS